MIAGCLRASPTCSPPASAGPSCRELWATALAGPAGPGVAFGSRPACSTGCIGPCWTGSASRTAGLVASMPGLGQRPREKRGELTGPNPTDRAKRGTKYHLLVDRTGLPLTLAVSGATRHDSMLVEPILDSMPPITGVGRGHPRRRPVKPHADKGYG